MLVVNPAGIWFKTVRCIGDLWPVPTGLTHSTKPATNTSLLLVTQRELISPEKVSYLVILKGNLLTDKEVCWKLIKQYGVSCLLLYLDRVAEMLRVPSPAPAVGSGGQSMCTDSHTWPSLTIPHWWLLLSLMGLCSETAQVPWLCWRHFGAHRIKCKLLLWWVN